MSRIVLAPTDLNLSNRNSSAIGTMDSKFIALSSLMKSSSLSGLDLTELKTLLQVAEGRGTFSNFRTTRLPCALKSRLGNKDPCGWLEEIIVHSDELQMMGLGYLVLDTLQYLPRHSIRQLIPLLQLLPQHGIHVVMIDKGQSPIFFTTMREVTCTDQFLDIYVQSLWLESMVLNKPEPVLAPRSSKAHRKPAREFKMLERIFVT